MQCAHYHLLRNVPYPSSHPAYIYVHFLLTTHFGSEDGGNTVFWNVCIQSPYYTVQQSRKPLYLILLIPERSRKLY